jgi:death on curing protein
VKWDRVQFLTIEDVMLVHDEMLGRFGGADGMFGHHSLEASVMAVQATYGGEPLLRTLADIAAGYAYYITTSHPFVDGNKRTALGAALTFLYINRGPRPLVRLDAWQDVMVAVACGKVSREELAEAFAAEMGEWGELD